MRRAACLFALLATSAALACSGSDGGAVGSDAGTNAGDGGASGSSGAPPGCTVKSDGPRSGTKAVSIPRGAEGGAPAPWQAPDQALAADGVTANAELTDPDTTDELRISGFGFAIPEGARVVGLELELKRQGTEANVFDVAVAPSVPGKTAFSRYVETPWPTKIVGTHVYGGANDTWQMALTGADVDSPDFAATLVARRDDTFSVTAKVDALRVTVHYCE